MNDIPRKKMKGKLENHEVHSLGHRAFYLFLFRRTKYIVIVLAVLGLIWYAAVKWVPADYSAIAFYVAQVASLAAAAILFMIVFRAYLEYRYYTYTFTDQAFLMTSGVIIQREFAAPYHQIQHVIIKRTMSDRAIGVSQILIYLAGADKEESQMKLVLPAISKKKAKLVQGELLARMQQKA
jgi:membrane protein YdbS with pleckstrin-like domain